MSNKPAKAKKTAIRFTREADFPKWYQEVIVEADMAENSGVRGCMVIKPWGFGIWENLKAAWTSAFGKRGTRTAISRCSFRWN